MKKQFFKAFALFPCRIKMRCSLILFSCLSNVLALAQFTSGNLVVLQLGNGASPLINSGNQILLREFSPLGVLGFSVAISTSLNPMVIGGSALSEGALSLTPNGKFLVFAGYASDLTYTASLSAASSFAINRGIGIVNVAGTYSRIVTSNAFYSGNSIRSATSDGNNNYWAAGANAGANYFGTNAPIATLQNSITNTRNVIAFNGNLYLSTGSGSPGIYKVGNGFPLSAPQTCSLIINTSGSGINTASPFAFYFNNTQTICYVADDRTPINGGGIQKWVNAAGTWTLAYTLSTGGSFGARAVVADFSGNNPKVYATTSEGSANRLIAILDQGVASTATALATASFNTIFRGLAFAPFCGAAAINNALESQTLCAAQAFTLEAPVSGTGPLTYSWSGPAGFSSPLQSPTLIANTSGIFTLTLTNGCGLDVKSFSITTNPVPLISVNAATICPGGTALLFATGANSYTWSNAAYTPSVALSPTATSVYTVAGTSQQGCVAASNGTVFVIDSLNISVNSEAFCLGNTATLVVSGASSFTWSNGSNNQQIVVTPLVTSQYSVSGRAEGCALATAVATVEVFQAPTVFFDSLKEIYCKDELPLLLSAQPPGGSFTGTGVSDNVWNPDVNLSGTFTLTYLYTDNNTCSNSDTAVVAIEFCTGFASEQQIKTEICYPNPVLDFLTIELNQNEPVQTIEIFDAFARSIFVLSSLGHTFQLDVHNYTKGLYFVRIRSQHRQFVLKFVKA
jgi:hypothetical protein